VERQEAEVLPLLERSDALAEGAFRARELSLVEWVSARERALRARLEYLDSLLRYRKSLVELETAMGESPPGTGGGGP
jgi:outer membrane protein TolC